MNNFFIGVLGAFGLCTIIIIGNDIVKWIKVRFAKGLNDGEKEE